MKTVLKRALCGITAFVVAAGAMSYFPADTFPGIARGVTAYAENETNETWRITITADNLADISGDGSEGSPYEITTAEELLAVMEARRTIYAILNDDIVINKDLLKRIDKESGEPSDTSDSIVCWPPIPDGWCINLDGKNHTISGLYINESGKAGLYASLGVGSFKNLTITDSFVKGGDNVGVLIGDSSYSTDSLSADNVKIENTIVRGNNCVGGLFGSLETTTDKTKYTITSCTVGPNVTVTGTGSKIGGIAGKCRGTITNCTVGSKVTVTVTGTDTDTGNRVGGIAGEFAGKFRGTILYSSSAATVTGKNFVGGVVGYAGGVARIWYCHNDGTVKGETSVGGVLGYGDGGNENPIRYIYNTGDVSGDNDVAGLVGTAKISPKYSYNIGNVAYNDGSIAPQLMNYSSYFAGKRCLFYLENTLPFSESGKREQTTTFRPNESNQTALTFTKDQVDSGELAWKLNLKSDKSEENGYANCWVQNLGSDKYPTFGDARYAVYPSKTGYHNHGSADQIDCDDCRGVAWDPYYPVSRNYSGTPHYEITNYHELLGLAKLVNEKNETITASLMNDIVFNENLLDANGNVQVADPIKWTPIGNTPIGTKDSAFEWGEFDGQGHFITNLTVSDTSLEYAGLFGYVTDHATIKNLGVFGEFSGGEYVGGIAGYSENSEITNCFFIGTVSGTNTNGIANEDIIGDTVKNCYFQSDSTDINARTEKQFKSGEVAELLNMLPNGGTQEVWGQTIGADAYPCALTSDNKVIRDYTNLGWHNHTNGTTEDTCPNCVKTPKQENGVYQISTIQELYWFSAYVNNTDSSIKAELANNITVNEDISAQNRIIWTPAGTGSKPFTGTFDGNGHIISGLVKENATEPVGLFGMIGSGAEVSNVGVVNCIFSSTDVAGGIAGINEGTITDSYIYGISPGNGAPIAASGTGKTDNCFVLNTTNDPAEIAYKLNRSSQKWGCKIGNDKLPTAINEENRVYFGKTYHNHDKNTLYCDDCCDFILTKPTEESGWYLISKPGELAWFARLINGGIDVNDHTNAKAKLTADLDFSAYTDHDYNWTPIGTEDNPFSGIFDGNSHTISGLKSSGADHAGLFGYADGASISKLIVNGCDFSGNKSAAAMCGSVGTNGVTFNFCGSYDNTLTGTDTAGFAGISAGKVTLDRCYTADRDKFSDGNNRVSVSYAISGNAADDAMTEAQFKSGELTYALNNGLDKAVWFQTINTQAYPQFSGDTVYKTSPCVRYTNDSAKTNKPHDIGDDDKCKVCGERGIPKKNSNGQYELSSKLHMLWFAKNFSSGEDSAVLMDNIDMKDVEWTPIGTKNMPFSGNFDGNGHTISGLNYSGEYAGLFGYMNNGTISNIKLADSSFANGTASGGICAVNNGGTIENSAVDNVAVSGETAGGICGQNSGTITDCFFSGNVSSDRKSGGICGSNSGTIKSTVSLYAGAAVGENANGDIENCFYNSDIAGRQKFGSGLETTGLTDPSILKKLGNSWSKAVNTTTVLFYPELTFFKTDKYSVRVKYRLTLENTDKAPAYKDTLHFVFDVQSAPENSKKWNSIVANLAYNNVRQQDFELSLDGVKLEIDAAPVVGNRLNLMLDGRKIGVLYMDKTLKVRIEITYPLNAGKHTISVKYVGSGFDYLAGESAECAFTISKAIITDPEASVEYGKALKDAELTEGWEWTNSSAVPNSKSRKFKAVMTVDDENYDLSGIKGLNGNKLTREVEVSFKKAVPAVTVTTDPFSALPGTKITVSVSAVNPNNAKFSDVPAAELFYTAGGTVTAITGGSFVIPDGLEEETVITVTAKTEENEFYKAGNGSAEVIVSAHKWSREWKTDKDGHWRECTDCGIAGEKSAHVSGGAATETTAEKCTVCGYVITPALKVVEAPVITPDGGSFTGSQTVTITCATDGAAIHYTTDGTEPTASSTKYSGGFTITATTTIKAVAFVGEAKSSVTSAAFTRKAQSGGSGGSVRPTRTDTEPRPSIDGKSMSWAEISVELAKRQDGSTVKIMLNGAYEVPADVIRVIAGKKLHIEFVADSLKSWLTDGAKISAVTAADLSVIPGSADRSALRGISGADLRVSGTKIPADLKLSFRKEFAGQFANVYKPANGKLVFHGCAKLGADGAAIIPGADSAGEYVVMVCEFSDMPGDINNDGVLNALDASAVLKCVVGISQGANPLMGDFNKDGTVNAIDASDILKWIIRS